MKIPDNKQWTQGNDRVSGILAETQNLTFDSGRLRVSRKPFNRYNSSDDADLGYVLGITYYSGQYYVLTDDNAFSLDFGGATVTERTLTTDVGLNSDIQVIYDRVYITTNDNVDYWDGALTTDVEALTADVPHPMTVFDSFTTYKLAIGDDNTVTLLDSSNAASGTDLALPSQYQVTTLAYRNGYLYVGTKHTNGGEAKIFVWDGNSVNANFEIPVGASWVYSIIPYKTTVAFVTNMGQLCAISGNAPVTLATFPVYHDADAIWDDGTNVSYIGKIMHRGMVAVGDLIYLNVNGTVDSGFIPEMKHGLWVYDPKVGLYHRSFHSIDRSVIETPSNLSSNTLTLSTHNLKTGDILTFRAVGSLTGVQTATRYYVKVESLTTVKLAISRKALQNADYVTIGGSIGVASVSYVPNTDWGAGFSQFQGAVTAINPEEPIFRGWESPIIWGARVSDFDGNAFYCVMSFTDAWNIGRFTTQRIYSPNITDTWSKLITHLDGIHLDNENVVIKYKHGNELGYPTGVYGGTWASATTITSVSASQDEDEWADLEEGDELTIVDGYGRGYTTHITTIAVNGTDYTITVDESIGSSTKAVYFYADKFRKIKSYDNTRSIKDIINSDLQTKSDWIQLKVELRGYVPEVAWMDLAHTGDGIV